LSHYISIVEEEEGVSEQGTHILERPLSPSSLSLSPSHDALCIYRRLSRMAPGPCGCRPGNSRVSRAESIIWLQTSWPSEMYGKYQKMQFCEPDDNINSMSWCMSCHTSSWWVVGWMVMSTDSISYAVEREWKPEAPRSTVIPHPSRVSLGVRFARNLLPHTPYTRPRACPRILQHLLVDCRQFCFSITKAKKARREQIDFWRDNNSREGPPFPTSIVRWELFLHRETDVEMKQHGCLDEGTEPMVTEYQESTFVKEVI